MSSLTALSLSKNQTALEFFKKDLVNTFDDIKRPDWALTPEDNQKILTYLSHQRASALGDFAYVSTIEWVAKSIYLPMLMEQPDSALYAAYNINSESNATMLRSLWEAVDYIKSVSLITLGITEQNAMRNAEIMTINGFKQLLNYVKTVFENNRNLSVGDSFENLMARHYPTNWLETTIVPVADSLITSYDTRDTTRAFYVIGKASNLNVPTKIKYAFSTPIEAAVAISQLRQYVPFALTRIANLSAGLDAMADYKSQSTNTLYQLMEARGNTPGIGEAELL